MRTIPDHDTFGWYAPGLHLRVPTNLRQRVARLQAERFWESDLTVHAKVLQVTQSMRTLNQWARHRQGDNRNFVYSLKTDFLHLLSVNGYVARVEGAQQILRCHACEYGVWERGTDHAERCFKCDGTGIYKRLRLFQFTIRVSEQEFVFHQPDSLAPWAKDLLERKFEIMALDQYPKYEYRDSPRVVLSDTEFQTHLLRVAVMVSKWMWFEQVRLCGVGGAVKQDLRALANYTARRIRHAIDDAWYAFVRERDELPF